MEHEDRALVQFLEPLQGFDLGVEWGRVAYWHQELALVHDPLGEPQSGEGESFDHWRENVQEHGLGESVADIVEPVTIVVRVDPLEDPV